MQPERFLPPFIHDIVTTELIARFCVGFFVVGQIDHKLDISGRKFWMLGERGFELVDRPLESFEVWLVVQPQVRTEVL